MEEANKISNAGEWYDAEIVDEKPTRLSGIVFFFLCGIPLFAAIAYGAVDAWALAFLTILTFLAAVFWTLDTWKQKEFRFSSNALQLPLLGLILIGLIQLLPLRSANISTDLLPVPAARSLSLDPYSTRFAIMQLLVYFVFFAAALVFINNRKRLKKIVLTIIIFAAAMAFFGILQRLANIEAIYGLRPSPQAIPFASFINQHHFAAFMEMTIAFPLALLFGRATKKDKIALLVIAAVLMGIAIVLTGSRGAFLSLIGVVGFIIAVNLLQKRKNDERSSLEAEKNPYKNFALIGGGIALILVLLGAVIFLGGDESLLRGIGLQNPNADATSGRTHYWQIAVKVIFDYPFLGAGLNSFGTAYTQYDTWNGAFQVEHAHNDYLEILADAGILGFACIAVFIYLLFKQSLQIIRKSSDRFRLNTAIGALAGCFGILVHSFFDFPLRTPSNGFFFLLLAVIATVSITYPKLYRKEK